MGKYILFCFFSIFFTNNYAQQGNFFETYSSSLEVRFFDAIPTRDGGYAMCGSDAGFNGGDFIVIKTDSIGHINWTYRNNEFDGLDFDNAAYKLVETEDSSIIIAGGLRDINGFTDMFYAKFSKSGSQVWRKNNPFSNFHMGPDALTYENDSTLILIGRVGGGKYFFKFNTNGDTLRTKRIPFQNNEIYSVNKTIKLRGYYYMCGNSSISLQHITKIDTLGNLIWSKTTADTLGSHFYDVRILNDSTLMSLNFFSGASISDFDKICFYDTSGVLVSSIKMPNALSGGGNFFDDSNYVFPHFSLGDTVYAQKTDFNHLTQTKFKGSPSQYMEPNIIFRDLENGIIFSGSIDDGNNTNSLGFLMRFQTDASIGISPIQFYTKIKIFPNPAAVFININIDKSLINTWKYFTIKLYDQFGKIVVEKDKVTETATLLNTHKLNGVYFYEISAKDNSISGKIIIIN